MEWPSGRWRAPAAEMGPQQQFSTTQSCICWHIFSSCYFLCFSLQIFRHSEVHHWEECYWWHIFHKCLVFSCICACILIGFCKKMYIVLQFCIGVFAFCPKLTFGEIFVGKLQGTTMKKRVCGKSFSKLFSILISELVSYKFCILT